MEGYYLMCQDVQNFATEKGVLGVRNKTLEGGGGGGGGGQKTK